MDLDKQLEQIGLSEKEAKVYNALLEVREATAQEISIRAGLNRATAYVILEELIKKGLVANKNKHKKNFYALEQPTHLVSLLEKQKNEIEVKLNQAKRILPELESFKQITCEKASVKFFEDIEGIKIIQNDIYHTCPKHIDQIFNINEALKHFPVSPNDHRQRIKKKNIIRRNLIVYNQKEPIPYLPLFNKEERRYLPQNKIPFNAEFVLYNNKAVLLSNKNKYLGLMIENKELVDGLKFIFELAWLGAEKYQVIKRGK